LITGGKFSSGERLEAIPECPREGAGEGETKQEVDIGPNASEETLWPSWKIGGDSPWKGVVEIAADKLYIHIFST